MQELIKDKLRVVIFYAQGFFITGIIMILLLCIGGFAPFGNNSLVVHDANYQYVDFFNYLLNVFKGQDNITYSFSKMLGGTGIGLFSYYLSSPFNIFVIFFEKNQIHSFFDLIFVLKVATAALTCQIFLIHRFHISIKKGNYWNQTIVIALSVSYALSQYNLEQVSNIMWLDGVYMLPLILLGVYKIVKRENKVFLACMIGLSILFNWYSAGINCLFSIVWLFFEMALSREKRKAEKDKTKKASFKIIINYGIAMLWGIGISAVLFLPSVLSMRGNDKSALNFYIFKNISLEGRISSAIQRYALGSNSIYGGVSLFAGSLVLIGLIRIFATKRINHKKKVIFGGFGAFLILCFYWRPLMNVYSLFKGVGSYWYRYSYIGIIFIIFLAAYYYFRAYTQLNVSLAVKILALYIAVQVGLNFVSRIISVKMMIAGFSCMAVILAVLS